MFKKDIILGIGLLLTTLSLNAAELAIPLQLGKPSQQEFQLAAKRALYSRNYEIWSVDPDVVIGKYRNRVEMAVILTDTSIILRDVDNGGVRSETINKYLLNLRRDLTYELAKYALAPQAKTDADKLQALIASARGESADAAASTSTHVLSGRYQSQVTVSGNYAFKRASQRNLIITFKQDGNEVTGVNESANLTIWGTIEGDVIRFRTSQSDVSGYELKGTWKISADGRRLTGKWSFSHGDGDWNLTKI